MKRAALYARVSTHEQADKGTSLDTQVAESTKKAQQLGWQVTPEHIIREDRTGKDLERPGLMKLFDLAASGAIQSVIFHTLDRLYRPENDGDEWRVFEVLDRLRSAGVEVAWVDATIPSEGPLASIFMFLDSWRSGRERRQMVERSVRGKREKARRGKVVNPHSLPKWLRYDAETDRVELDEEWSQVGRFLFRLVAEEGMTLRGVSHSFRTLGLRSPIGRTVWQPTTLRNWLENPAARGEFHQLRWDTTAEPGARKRVRRLRPREERFLLKVPALVSEETWDAVQHRLEPAVWEAVTRLLQNPDRLREELHRRRDEGSTTRDVAEQDRLVEGYGKGLIPDDRMTVRMSALR